MLPTVWCIHSHITFDCVILLVDWISLMSRLCRINWNEPPMNSFVVNTTMSMSIVPARWIFLWCDVLSCCQNVSFNKFWDSVKACEFIKLTLAIVDLDHPWSDQVNCNFLPGHYTHFAFRKLHIRFVRRFVLLAMLTLEPINSEPELGILLTSLNTFIKIHTPCFVAFNVGLQFIFVHLDCHEEKCSS